MDKKRLILAVLMVVLAGVMFWQLQRLGQNNAEPVAQPVQPVTKVVDKVKYDDILVASTDITFGTKLNESHFKWKQWPSEAVSESHITRKRNQQAIEEFTGGIVKSEFFADDPISLRKIVIGESSIMSALLSPGMRAVTTRISVDTAAGGFIRPGDHVDIILTSSMVGMGTTGGSSKRYVSETIFENVRVLAIDQNFSNSGEGGAAVIGSTATFEMTQDDSEVLQQSVAQGDLSLTLRPLGKGNAPGKSHATVKRKSGDVSSLTIYRDGQPTQVAIRGQ